MAQNKDLVADAQTLLEENLSEKKSVESARRLGLIAVEDCIDLAKLGLERYISESDERLIIAARREIDTRSENEEEFKRRMKMERKAEWKEKALHGQHLRQTENIASILDMAY